MTRKRKKRNPYALAFSPAVAGAWGGVSGAHKGVSQINQIIKAKKAELRAMGKSTNFTPAALKSMRKTKILNALLYGTGHAALAAVLMKGFTSMHEKHLKAEGRLKS